MFFAKFASSTTSTTTTKLSALYQRASQLAAIQEEEVLWAIQQPLFLEDLEHGTIQAHRLVNLHLDLLLAVVYVRLQSAVGCDTHDPQRCLTPNVVDADCVRDEDPAATCALEECGDGCSPSISPRCGSVSPRISVFSRSSRSEGVHMTSAGEVTLSTSTSEVRNDEEIAAVALRMFCGRSPATARVSQTIFEFAPTQQTPWGDMRTTKADECDRKTVAAFFLSGRAAAWSSKMELVARHLIEVVLRSGGSAPTMSARKVSDMAAEEGLCWSIVVIESIALMASDLLAATHFRASRDVDTITAIDEVLRQSVRALSRLAAQCLSAARNFLSESAHRHPRGAHRSNPTSPIKPIVSDEDEGLVRSDPYLHFARTCCGQVFHTQELCSSVEELALLCGAASSVIETVVEVLQLLVCRHKQCSQVVASVLHDELAAADAVDDSVVVVLVRHLLSIPFVSKFPSGSVGESHLMVFFEELTSTKVQDVRDAIVTGVFGVARRWTDVVCGVDSRNKGITLLELLLGLHTSDGAVGKLSATFHGGRSAMLHADELDDGPHLTASEADDMADCQSGDVLASPTRLHALLLALGVRYLALPSTDSVPSWVHPAATGQLSAGTAAVITARLLQENYAYESASLHRIGKLRSALAVHERELYASLTRKGVPLTEEEEDHFQPPSIARFVISAGVLLDEFILELNPLLNQNLCRAQGMNNETAEDTAPTVLATPTTLQSLLILLLEIAAAVVRAATAVCCLTTTASPVAMQRLTELLQQIGDASMADRYERLASVLSSPCQQRRVREHVGKLGPALLLLTCSAIRTASKVVSGRACSTAAERSPPNLAEAMRAVHDAFRAEFVILGFSMPQHAPGLLCALVDDLNKLRCCMMGLRAVPESSRTAQWCRQRFGTETSVLQGDGAPPASCDSDATARPLDTMAADHGSSNGATPSSSADLFSAWDNPSPPQEGEALRTAQVDLFATPQPAPDVAFPQFPTTSAATPNDEDHQVTPAPTPSIGFPRGQHRRTLSGIDGVLSPTTKGAATVGGTLDLFAVAPVSWDN